MASWLMHKFAKIVRHGLGSTAIVLGAGALGGIGMYDFFGEDMDHVEGSVRDKTVQTFENQIEKVSVLQSDLNELIGEQEQAKIMGDIAGNAERQQAINASSSNLSSTMNSLKDAFYLTTVTGEDDFERIATYANDEIGLDVDTDGAAFLHECQTKTPSQLTNIKSCMKIEENSDHTPKENMGVFVIVLVSLLAGGGASSSLSSSYTIRSAANNPPEPSRVMQKIQETNTNRRRRRNQKKLEN